MESKIIRPDSAMRALYIQLGRQIIPHDAPPTQPSGEYRMLPPKPSITNSRGVNSDRFPSNSTLEPKSFTLFPELPQELRLKIWRHAFPTRVVKINSYGVIKKDNYLYHAFYSTTPLPIVLSVCSESRAETLRHYHPSFGMREPAIPSIIYFNYELDTLYFEFDSHQAMNSQLLILALSDRYRPTDRRLGMNFVQSVAVSHRIGVRMLKSLLKYSTRFQSLREFIIGAERESPPVSDSALLEEPDENDETLSGLRKFLDEQRDEWNKIWSQEYDDESNMHFPKLKVMEVRGRGT